MTFGAIPTLYKGIQFRSRLEARWAAFFDLLEWPWEYEPIDLQGYIPDFVLGFERPMIVEVKPLLGKPYDWRLNTGWPALLKAVLGGWDGEGLLVGAALYSSSDADGCVGAGDGNPTHGGLLFSSAAYSYGGSPTDVYSAPFGFSRCCGGPVDCLGSYVCRRCGFYDGNNALMPEQWVREKWNEAGNRVQWKSPSKAAGKHQHVPLDEIAAFFRRMASELGGE